MPEATIQDMREAIRGIHGCDSAFVESVPVVERMHVQTTDPLKGGWRTVWEGAVCVFDLIGHPTAKRAYAWSSEVPGTNRRRFVAVPHEGRVNSPERAVQASIVADSLSGMEQVPPPKPR